MQTFAPFLINQGRYPTQSIAFITQSISLFFGPSVIIKKKTDVLNNAKRQKLPGREEGYVQPGF